MQKYAITIQYTRAEQEKRALEVIMEAIYDLMHNDASPNNIEGENNGDYRGSA